MSGQTDQSRPVSRVSVVEALTQIRALCDGREHGPGPGWVPVDEVRAVLDAVSVDATPPQDINRDALMAILMEQWTAGPRETADRILALLALVRPAEGVVLSREEAALIVKLVRLGFAGDGSDDLPASALASRLEASS